MRLKKEHQGTGSELSRLVRFGSKPPFGVVFSYFRERKLCARRERKRDKNRERENCEEEEEEI